MISYRVPGIATGYRVYVLFRWHGAAQGIIEMSLTLQTLLTE